MADTDTVAFLMRNLEENWILARQAEEKRALIAHIALILAFLILGAFFITGRAFLALLLIFLGIYGLLTTAKLYERSQYHILRARKVRARIGELCPDAQLELLYKLADEEQHIRYPRLMRVRLNTIWSGFYAVLIVLGVVLAVMGFLSELPILLFPHFVFPSLFRLNK